MPLTAFGLIPNARIGIEGSMGQTGCDLQSIRELCEGAGELIAALLAREQESAARTRARRSKNRRREANQGAASRAGFVRDAGA